ncbi:hypothetical protein CROQUDRAFT_73335 [Cronartium quercuum f. sp. fusiforme G11]|uniref:Mitochondrial carrier protein n=1 Tax=Cronartium quercuum f. sp. fusiforme G11 TaxID=708437 RepID=A0A9P6NQC0_9BASI|nr:hypothetical protein CROQUDRAFT_73335 [Cronartium quercuum f. sp. fusiforme G11]
MTTKARSNSNPVLQPNVLAASSLAAAMARLLTHPMDTIRLRIQTHHGPTRPPLRQLIPSSASELYAGLPVALFFSVPALSIYLSSYEVAKRFWTPLFINPNRSSSSPSPSLMQQFPAYMLSGLSAEIVSGWVWTPMEVTKSRLQKGNEGTSAIKLLKKIAQTEGVSGIWRGYTVSLAVYGPYTALYWPVYEQTKAFFIPSYDPTFTVLSRHSDPESEATAPTTNLSGRYALCAALSCIVSAGLTHPIAVVQSTVQTSGGMHHSSGSKVSPAMGPIRSALDRIWKEGGTKGFTRGAVARMAYMVPSNIISMSTYELLKVHWGVQ